MSLSNEKIYKHSCCVHVRYKWANPLEHATIRPDLLKPVGTRSDLSRPVWTRWDPLQPVETRYPIRSDLLEHVSSRCIFYFLFSILHLKKIHLQLVEYEGNTKIKIKIKIIHPPPPPPSPIPPIFPIFFFMGGGEGGEGRGTGRGRRRRRGATTTAGRSPPRRGGDKVPPPSPPSGVYKSNTTCTYAWENKNILWIRKINAYNYNYKLKSVPQKCH